MRSYKKTEKYELDKITCDVCKKTYSEDENRLEFSEFISLDFNCGYGSETFGDLMMVKLDLCQYCFYTKLGRNCRIKQGSFDYLEWNENE